METSARTLWRSFHWTFFIDVQGLILSLLRFEQALSAGRLEDARVELECAAVLMRASGAAMQLAGSFPAAAYRDEVRPSMVPPHVRSSGFSGLMCWEHARLVRLWQQLGPALGALPAELDPAHQGFVGACIEMITAHRAVCQRFVGDEASSLRSQDSAVGILEKVLRGRLRIIDPAGRHSTGCPFSAAATGDEAS